MTGGGSQRIPRPEGHRPGRPAAWVQLPAQRRRLSLAQVRERLADLPPARVGQIVPEGVSVQPGSRDAAVLVPLFEERGEARVVLTKRPDTMPSHRGEIAFPGGKHEVGVDADLCATALREAHEEIGLAPSAVEVVARLDSLATVASRFVITPFVGFLDARPTLVPDAREVVSVFDVPLSALMGRGVHREERWDTWIADLDVHFFELDRETVWGATARILAGFLTHLVAGPG